MREPTEGTKKQAAAQAAAVDGLEYDEVTGVIENVLETVRRKSDTAKRAVASAIEDVQAVTERLSRG